MGPRWLIYPILSNDRDNPGHDGCIMIKLLSASVVLVVCICHPAHLVLIDTTDSPTSCALSILPLEIVRIDRQYATDIGNGITSILIDLISKFGYTSKKI